MSSGKESIKVVCRLRPLNTKEKDMNTGICMSYTKESVKIISEVDKNAISNNFSNSNSSSFNDNSEFTFDRIFEPETNQAEVFEYAAKPIIDGALEGWNGTLFCYGQTSSGKTHTMEGLHDIPELRGVIPRMMEYVFEAIRNASRDLEFSVKCSFLEIYNEKIQDLLDPRKNNLMVKEEKGKGIWVDDATEIYVLSKEEMNDVFKIGSENRKVGSTLMNSKSSRSHSLFIVTIFQKNSNTDSTKTGKLYFVDLAGSEKMSKTGIEGGQQLEEAKNINKSLLNLGMVINALTESRTHVPYRDSKLTRVLQESLGGNSQTTLIINCSMSKYNDKESLSTLRFGQRAKAIKNKVVLNTEISAKELLIKLHAAEEKIKYYQNLLQNGGLDINLNNKLFSKEISNLSENNFNKKEKIKNESDSSYRKDSNSSQVISSPVSCEDCSNAMRKLLNQHIEMVNLQDELERAKTDKQELEEEINNRNSEMYELSERVLISELKAKLFIENELKTFNELQMRLEHIFLLNQNKLLETNKLRNIIDKTRNELILLYKSKKGDKNIPLDSISKYAQNLDECLDILNKIEEYILGDNKNFNDLVEFISGKNSDEMEHNSTSSNKIETQNINLNINKNININIIEKRRNSVSFRKNRENFGNYTKSCTPCKSRSINLQSANIQTIKINSPSNLKKFQENIFVNEDELISNKSFDAEYPDDEIKPDTNFNQIIKQQRKTIHNLANEFILVKDSLSNIRRENLEKDFILNKNNENITKTESKIKEYEEIINILNEKVMNKQEEFDLYKTQTMMDFEYKEKKIVDLIGKVSDLEDENYKLVHFNKDKDKKKFYIMEKQVKELTNEMQKLITENTKLKSTIDKKDEEIKNISTKVSDLENRLVQSLRNKMNEISFANNGPDLQSGICTPITSCLNKGFQCSTLGDILTAKLKKINSISPEDRRSSSNSNSSFTYNQKSTEKTSNQNGSTNNGGELYNNIKNVKKFESKTSMDSNSPRNQKNSNTKIMRVIRGGGGIDYADFKNYNSNNKNFFFTKMLNQGGTNTNPENSHRNKASLNKLKIEKYEEEMKYLDNELNISKESELNDYPNLEKKSHRGPKENKKINLDDNDKRAKTPQKEKGGLFNFFSKIIK